MSATTRLTGLGLLAAALAAPGCGPSLRTVAGKITYQGKPVATGTVTLVAADGSMHQAGIAADGAYTIPNVPAGSAKVGVSSPKPAIDARAARGGDDSRVPAGPPPLPPGAWFLLPEKFADPATSGVTVQVGKGSADIDLK